MRWRFADPNNREESQHKARVVENIDAWWEAFVADADEIDTYFESKGKAEFDIPQWMHQHFAPIDERLCWEFGPAIDKDGHRLIFTPESHHFLHPVVETLLARAPRLPRWEFYVYRQPGTPEEAHAYVRGRSLNRLDYPDATVRLTRGENHLIDFTLRAAGVRSADDNDARNAAWMFCESLLGEENLDKWVGVIAVEPVPRPGIVSKIFGRRGGGDAKGGTFLPLERVKTTFDALKESIRDQLPDRPLHELDLTGTADWSSYQREPREDADDDDDEPGRDFAFVGTTVRFEVVQACIAPGFSGLRFSRFGETFCYLKLDSSGVDRSGVVAWRGAFEDALEPVLRREKLGCIYGTGASPGYMYIDLALTGVDRAMELIRSTLRPQLAPKRSWLLFFEPEYAQEWVGVWDDTPPPPAREDGSVG